MDAELDSIPCEGDAAAFESVFRSGETAEKHTVLRPEMDTLDTGLALDLQGRLGSGPIQQSDAPLIHEDMNRVRCAADRATSPLLHTAQ
jgi:hypothetical protein